jgi:molybdate transport system substrate-binding protein
VRRTLSLTVAVLAVVALVGPACSSSNKTDSGAAATTTSVAGQATGTITVSAASSLTGAFGTIKTDFVKAHPGSTVDITFDSSARLVDQIESGAPADVAAFADTTTMKKLADKNLLAGPSQIFATNQLVIVTKPGNPKNIKTLADLAHAGTIALCASTAPCGKYAEKVLSDAGVTIPTSSITRGENAKATLSAVANGDADAGIVYVTDGKAAGSTVSTVTIPPAQNAVAQYPIAVVKGTKNPTLAQSFMAYVLGPEGQAVLKEAGFGAP